MKLTTAAAALSLCSLASAKTWVLSERLAGADLIQAFNFEVGAGTDNGGIADYGSLQTSRRRGLLAVSATTGWTMLKTSTGAATPEGNRESIRMSSKKRYSGGLFVFDVTHMPTGCGVWPALWMVAPDNWPTGGEIDIIEGVHATTQNLMSTHTTSVCIQQTTGFTGTFSYTANPALANTCDVVPTNNQGCGVRSPSTKSFGASFNQAQGGVYALQWDTTGLRTYFWPRSAVPADITAGAPTGTGWGTPANYVSAAGCPMTHFDPMVLVVNTNLCGTWGSGVWSDNLSYAGQSYSCAAKTGYSTCEAYVRANGGAFRQAYWTIRDIKVYV
ncbi:concanavalin A-like lectin/glucanase domain-containing protein [Leucosporidium creatinivorum]|uniref:Concanavalin A-like lectin/glucanase domain-containing protein n=1 Tax=Leucosporidium creatinivorum TaxID=106004 RepID=A0A1Y2FIR6_9BASI|nr:concanavalin A-like lectin/glucanase domain-containing protein [Leucosporidium creatinivorum]